MALKKILIVSPKFPYPSSGACELDRAAGIEFFVNAGWEVQVITKVYAEEYKKEVMIQAERLKIKIKAITYKYLSATSAWEKVLRGIARLLQPWFVDGAAYEYSEPEIKSALAETLDTFKPDVVWFDYSYLWPLYKIVQQKKIPIITRSINFEPDHFLQEDGRSIANYLKYLPKLLSEYRMCRGSNVVCAITPDEALRYKKIGAKNVLVLPLRSLAHVLAEPIEQKPHAGINVFFSGSTYNVAHNRDALQFLLRQIIPYASQRFPGVFTFHIFGAKVPSTMESYFSANTIKHGYLAVDEFKKVMQEMDIAIVPSLFGAGMQQKIFEPLCRGIATITSMRGIAGYPFQEKNRFWPPKPQKNLSMRSASFVIQKYASNCNHPLVQ